MRLPAPEAVPPTTFPDEPLNKMPRRPFAIAAVPAAFVPIRLPRIVAPPLPCTWIPSRVLPEMTFPGPIVVAEAPVLTTTPSFVFPCAVEPSVAIPT